VNLLGEGVEKEVAKTMNPSTERNREGAKRKAFSGARVSGDSPGKKVKMETGKGLCEGVGRLGRESGRKNPSQEAVEKRGQTVDLISI